MEGIRDRDDEEQALIAPPFSEDAIALLFAELHGDALRYVAPWGRWLRYDGAKWVFDDKREVFSLARDLCREVARKSNKTSEAKAINSAKTRAAIVSLASDDQRLAATIDQWDADPWLLNTPGGVVDLRTGKTRQHRVDDYMTKITTVTPNASCSTRRWDKFLDRVTNKNKDLQAYLARVCGYSLTGITNEHAMFFLFGPGRNGKGVFMNSVASIVGDYHCTAAIETFTVTHNEQHPTELAMLRGARMVTATETEEGRRWAESRIKTFTGGDPIRARFMRQDFFEYDPQFKLMISGNHKPGLRSVDEAIRSRINLLPFSVCIPKEERDPELTDKLKTEWPGILAWMVKACVEWQRRGLAAPATVTVATETYLDNEDTISQWIRDCCEIGRQHWTEFTSLFKSWKSWAEDHGEYVIPSNRFRERLDALGYESLKQNHVRGRGGLGLNNFQKFASGPPK